MSCPFVYVRSKRYPTIRAFVMVDDVLANPPLYAACSEPQVPTGLVIQRVAVAKHLVVIQVKVACGHFEAGHWFERVVVRVRDNRMLCRAIVRRTQIVV